MSREDFVLAPSTQSLFLIAPALAKNKRLDISLQPSLLHLPMDDHAQGGGWKAKLQDQYCEGAYRRQHNG